jgi:hypothetical protein
MVGRPVHPLHRSRRNSTSVPHHRLAAPSPCRSDAGVRTSTVDRAGLDEFVTGRHHLSSTAPSRRCNAGDCSLRAVPAALMKTTRPSSSSARTAGPGENPPLTPRVATTAEPSRSSTATLILAGTSCQSLRTPCRATPPSRQPSRSATPRVHDATRHAGSDPRFPRNPPHAKPTPKSPNHPQAASKGLRRIRVWGDGWVGPGRGTKRSLSRLTGTTPRRPDRRRPPVRIL